MPVVSKPPVCCKVGVAAMSIGVVSKGVVYVVGSGVVGITISIG